MTASSSAPDKFSSLREGNLDQTHFPSLLFSIFLEESNIVLELTRQQLIKKVSFEQGIPVFCHSNLLHETFGQHLVERGKIDEEQNQKSLTEAAKTGERQGEVLLRWQWISAFDLFKELQQNLAHKLLDCFTWKDASFRLHMEKLEPESPLKISVPQLMLTGVTRFSPQEHIEQGIKPFLQKPLALFPEPPFPLSVVKVSAKFSRILSLFHSKSRAKLTMEDLSVQSKLPLEEVTRFIYAFHTMGFIVSQDQIPHIPESTKTKTPPAEMKAAKEKTKVDPDDPEEWTDEFDNIKNEITQFYLNYRKMDAFRLLNVPLDATSLKIRAAYLHFAHRYAPWRFKETELYDKVQDLFLNGAKAYAKLMDPQEKKSLTHKRLHPPKAPQESKKKPGAGFAIKTDFLDAKKHFLQGIKCRETGDYKRAIELLEFAANCDVRHSNYRAELAWCLYLLKPKAPQHALKELKDALRIDPECGIGLFYMSEIKRAGGDRQGAESDLRMACKFLKNDRRATEALKKLLHTKK